MDNRVAHILELIAQHQIRYGGRPITLQVDSERQALSFNYENAVKVFISPRLRPDCETKLIEVAIEFEAHGKPFSCPGIPVKLTSKESLEMMPEEFIAAVNSEIYRLSQIFTVVMNRPSINQQKVTDLFNNELSLNALFDVKESGDHCLHIGVINSELKAFVKAKIDGFRSFPSLYITDNGIKYVLHPKSKDEDDYVDIAFGEDEDFDIDEVIENNIVINLNSIGIASSLSITPR